MSSKFWAELSNDYEKLFGTEIGYNVVIYAGEEPNVKEIHAHSNILCIRKPNISPYLFNIILRFIYSVDELNIQQLISHIQEYLIEHQTEFLYQNATAPLLELLLKRDDLNMKEIEIWEGLLKWCLFQQNMENNPTKWSNDDIIKIKRSLYRFIPLVRFYDIEPTDFFYKVYIYKEILQKDLIHDLLEFHIVPNIKPKTNIAPSRKPNLNSKIDSTLIQSNHIPLFASWIDKKGPSSHYLGSKDSRLNTINWRYNPLDWNGNGIWKSTTDSFMFSFTDGKNISTAKLGYVEKPDNAIYCANNQGHTWVIFYCKGDNKWINYSNSTNYPDIGTIPTQLSVDYYKVYQIIKK
ncbi:unnamed protein product [Rhizophagus irregularis]|nr:unnamed protein product [Rhizophagus irregularis]